MCFNLSDFKCYGSTTSSFKNDLSNVKERSNEKIARIKISFPTYKTHFFLFFYLFGPLLLSNLITSLFLIHLKWFKVLQEHHLKFYKSSFNSYNKKVTYKDFFRYQELAFVAFGGFFFEFLTPSPLKGHNFLNSTSFLMIFSALEAPIRGVQVLFRHWKQWRPPFRFGLPWVFKCCSCNSIAN
jgi:hypothetical protein